MMDSWSRFRALDVDRRRLVFEAAVLVGIVCVGLRTMPLGRLRRLLERCERRRPARASASPGAIAWAVQAAARRFAGARTCLVEALAAEAMLRRRAYPSELRLGVRRGCDRSRLDGHAWVECNGVVVVGAIEDLESYAPD